MSSGQRYQLTARSAGTALFGMTLAQIGLMILGGLIAVPLVTAGGVSIGHGLEAALAVGGASAVAFLPWDGRPGYEMVPTVVRFSIRAVTDRNRWFAPVPVLTVDGRPIGTAKLPRCLDGLEIRDVARPEWAGHERSMAPVGLAVDRRSGAVTAVVAVKGSEFQLVSEAEQHRRIFGWGRAVAQFARESAPVARICWHEWSCPAPLSEHLAWLADNSDPNASAAAAYRELISGQSVCVARHELRVTITVDPRRLRKGRPQGARRAKRDAVSTAMVMVKSLSQRCREAGLIVSPPLSPNEIADAVRIQGDPAAMRAKAHTRGLAEWAGVVPVAYGPLAIDNTWDAVVIDGSWHRVFWVSAWPTLEVGPDWLEPLLLDTVGTRTVTMIMVPVNPRNSRRHLTKEAVGLQASIEVRTSKGFRVPVELRRAESDLSRREGELSSGFAEYQYLALIDVAAPSLADLDELAADYVNLAAQCGLELRSLDGRHDAAWGCTIPVGRAPDKDLIGAVA